MRCHAARLALLAVLFAPVAARADSIEGPPACPPGTEGRSSHAGQWCVPRPCATDAVCDGGARCRAWRVCTQTSMVTPGGRHAEPPPAAPQVLAVASCDPASACTGREEPPAPTVGVLEGEPACSDGTYCVPAALPALPARSGSATATETETETETQTARESAPTSGGSCACGTAGRRSASGAITLGALALAAIARRRR